MDVCIWCVRAPAVDLNGVGCVKRNGLEIVWVLIGLDSKNNVIEEVQIKKLKNEIFCVFREMRFFL